MPNLTPRCTLPHTSPYPASHLIIPCLTPHPFPACSLDRTLSQEVAGEGIRVNTVLPGPIATDMIPPGPKRESMTAGIPMGRIGEPSDIANVVSFLASDQAAFVAGAQIRVAGGKP